MINKLKAKIENNARQFGHVRFEEPIVIFESDDWGKVGGKSDGIYPKEFGTRTDWSFDQLETSEELDKLFSVLDSFKNDFERAPVFTANFVVSNPDFAATKAVNYQSLQLKTIDADFPELMEKWRFGIDKKVFYPQYHGRLHYNLARYERALQNDEKTRFLFDQGINGGLENFQETKYALYSEYQNCETEAEIAELAAWIATGLQQFKQIFGFASTTAISPNYVLPTSAIHAFKNTSVKFLQGGNKMLFVKNGAEQTQNFCQGKPLNFGITALARNHKFEPCRGKKVWSAEFSIKAAQYWLQRGIPAVIDTHRMNYIGKFAENSRLELGQLIASFRKYPNLKFLTSSELGEAISNEGNYTCVFTGEKKKITPKNNVLRNVARTWIK